MRTVNQDTLRQLEALCTQEQPPAAMALCPLHVECREICAAVSNGDFDAAYALYSKAVPFPGILSRLCTEPCGDGCVRRELGGAISMRKIEESIYTYGTPPRRRGFLPRKNQKAAVIGGSLYGVTAALELAKKGYKITLFEKSKALGGRLLREPKLPAKVLEKDLEILKEYPIEICYGKEIITEELPEGEYAGAIDAVGAEFSSVVYEIYEGRRAAITLDREMKQVSVEAGREREGSYETTLHVNTDEAEVVAPVLSHEIYTVDEAMKEASRCLDCKCLECVKSCAFLRHFKTFPRKYVREVYNNLSIAMGTRHANKMINACSICGQCKAICPNGLDVGAVVKDAREIMVETGKMPQSAFAFALEDMEQSSSPDVILTRHQSGMKESKYLFFPGCQLPASAPEVTLEAYQDLTKRLEGGVGILLGCCGITADWAGQEALYRDSINKLKERWKELGSPIVITACPTCYDVLNRELGEGNCTGIWDILLILNQGQNQGTGEVLKIRDACGAREYPHIHDSIRRLLRESGYEIEEDKYRRETSPCCGFGGLTPYSSSQVADEASRLAVTEKDWNYLTYCMNCRDRYTKAGARAVHLLELLYDREKGSRHQVPTWSLRQDNRKSFRDEMVSRFWEEAVPEEKAYPLTYSEELSKLLEERMILESSIRQVIDMAEQEGTKMLHRPTRCMVAHKQMGYVTLWVWYKKQQEGYYIEKAYSHRMEIREDT